MVGNLRQRVLIEGHLRQRALMVSHLGQRVLKVGHLRQRVLMVSHLGSEGRSPKTEGPDSESPGTEGPDGGSLGLRIAFIGGRPLSCPGILEALDPLRKGRDLGRCSPPIGQRLLSNFLFIATSLWRHRWHWAGKTVPESQSWLHEPRSPTQEAAQVMDALLISTRQQSDFSPRITI